MGTVNFTHFSGAITCIPFSYLYMLILYSFFAPQILQYVRGVIRKLAENSCHFYIFWSIELKLQHLILQNIMQLVGYNLLDVSRLRALQLSSRQCYIARASPFYVAFWRFTAQPINDQRFVKFCYAVIAHIAFNAYLTTYLLLFDANFQRFISNGWCSKLKRITELSKGKAFNFYEPIACFGMSIL